jgi:hypothetical protein
LFLKALSTLLSEPLIVATEILFESHDNAYVGHRGYASTLANTVNRLWWRRIRHDANDYCYICVVSRRVKERAQIVASLDPLHVPTRPWYNVGLDFLTRLHVDAGFDSALVVVDHSTRMAQFFPCAKEDTADENVELFLHGVYYLHGLPRARAWFA